MVTMVVQPVYTKVRLVITHVYLPGRSYPQRTHDSTAQAGIQAERDGVAVDGVKGKSPLERILDQVKGIPVDYMQCVLGVTKKVLETWMS